MTQQTLRHLAPDQVERFQLDGCLTVEDVLTPDEVAALAAHTATALPPANWSTFPTPASSSNLVFRRGEKAVTDQVLAVRKLYNIAVYDDVMWAHVTHPKIADIAADLLGTDDIKMYGDQLFMKAPRTGTGSGLASGLGLLARHFPHGFGLCLDRH